MSKRYNKFELGIEGMNCNTNPLLLKSSECELAKNVSLDTIGKITKRKGTQMYGSQIVASQSILGMYEFITSAGTSYQLAVCYDGSADNDIFKIVSTTLNGAITTSSTSIILTSGTDFASSGTIEIEGDLCTYTGKTSNNLTGCTGITHNHATAKTVRQFKISLADDTANKKTRFTSFLDYVFRVNGAEAMSSSADCTTWGTTNCLATLTPSLVACFQDRLFAAGDAANPDRLYASSLPSLAGAITWDTSTQIIDAIGSNGYWLDINPEDGCYDEQTEILTDRGWKFFKDLDKTEKVMTLNPDTNKLEWQRPIEYIKKDYNGEMVQLKSKSVDLLVTPNHQMFVEKEKGKINHKKNWKKEFVRADEIIPKGNSKIPRNGKWDGDDNDNLDNPLNIKTKDWVAFLGFWIAEGFVSGSVSKKEIKKHRVGITQDKHKVKVRELLKKTGLKWHETKNKNNNCITFYVTNEKLHKYLSKFGNSHTKYVPQDVKNLSIKYLEILWEWMMLGDGHRGNNSDYTYVTASKKLADDCLEILLKIGLSGRIFCREKGTCSKNSDIYVIREIHRKYAKFHWGAKSFISKQKYSGKIYCVEVPNHVLYVRRNGKPIFCGNSNITALERNGSNLVIFKDKSMYLWNGSSTQADTLIEVGAISQEVVKTVQNITFFLGRSKKDLGIFAFTGAHPKNIGRKVKKWIDAIDQTALSTLCAGCMNDKYILYIGDITFSGDDMYEDRTFSDVCLVYTISKDAWTIYDNMPARMFANYTVSSAEKLFYGDTNGKIFEIENGQTDDNGDSQTEIEMEFIGKEEVYESPYYPKSLEEVCVYSQKAQGTTVKYRIDRNDWRSLGEISSRFTVLPSPERNDSNLGQTIQLKMTNSSDYTTSIEGMIVSVDFDNEVRKSGV